MAQASRDQNFVPTLLGVSSTDGTTPIAVYADPTTHRLLTDAASGAGTVTSVSVVSANGLAGTVATSTTTPAITLTTTVTGILSGNGTAISAASTTGSGNVVLATTPTLTTPIIGVATGTSLSVSGLLASATGLTLEETGAGTDVITLQAPASITAPYTLTLPIDDGGVGELLSTNGSGVLSWVAAGGTGTVTDVSVASANGFAGTVATSTTTPVITLTTSITGLLKGNATAISAATAGSDYAVGSIGLAGGQTIAGSTLTLENLTLRANAADLTTGQVNITSSKEATNTTTASVAIAGGLAVAKRVYALDMTVTNAITGSVTGNAGTASAVAAGGITGLGTGVATALAVNVGSAGAFLVNGGVLGTPSSGTVTNLTGTASININGTVGATTATTGVFTTATVNTGLVPDANDGAYLGQAGTAFSDLFLAEGAVINWDSGDATLTQTGNVLELAGADLTVPNLTIGAAGVITLSENAALALDPAGSADGKYSGITITATAGYTQAFGDLVYLAVADSRWEAADADAIATGGQMLAMVVVAGTDGNSCTLLLQGQIRADAKFPALTVGAPVYVGETAGAIQVAIPTGADNVIRVVGYALTADEIYFNPSGAIQTTVA